MINIVTGDIIYQIVFLIHVIESIEVFNASYRVGESTHESVTSAHGAEVDHFRPIAFSSCLSISILSNSYINWAPL